jgi:site-specific recombinase XerD
MPQVYTGKVVIPGDRLDAYLEALQEAEALRAPFRSRLNGLNTEFGNFLATKYSKRTVAKHTGIVELFIHFLCDYTDVMAIEEITKGMVNSQFRRWYKSKVWDSTEPDELRVALKKFFQFLDQQKGIQNEKVLAALK